jgi:hypothetical protein
MPSIPVRKIFGTQWITERNVINKGTLSRLNMQDLDLEVVLNCCVRTADNVNGCRVIADVMPDLEWYTGFDYLGSESRAD